MRATRWMRAIVIAALTSCVTSAVVAQGGAEIAGAGAAPFPPGTTVNVVALQGLQFGMGAASASDGAVTGDVHVTLVGTSALGVRQEILYVARVDGVFVSEGVATV